MSIVRGRRVVAGVAVGLALVAAACGAEDAGGTSVDVTLTDTSIRLSTQTAPAGGVTFQIRNDGSTVHEFEIFRTELAHDRLTVESGVVADEGIELINEVEDLAPGISAELSLDLEPGGYVVICNVSGHYEAGMHTAFAVT